MLALRLFFALLSRLKRPYISHLMRLTYKHVICMVRKEGQVTMQLAASNRRLFLSQYMSIVVWEIKAITSSNRASDHWSRRDIHACALALLCHPSGEKSFRRLGNGGPWPARNTHCTVSLGARAYSIKLHRHCRDWDVAVMEDRAPQTIIRFT